MKDKFTKLLQNFAIIGVLVSAPLYPSYIKTPQDLGKWISNSFTYQKEEVDYWKTPEETVKDKGGDCEDFAILAKKILKDLGYEPHLVVLRTTLKAHAICVFKEKNGTWSAFDNTYYRQMRLYKFKDSMDRYYSRFKNVYNCVDKDTCKKIYTIKGD